MKARLATPIGKTSVGPWNEKCGKTLSGRHERIHLGATEWEQVTKEKIQVCDCCGAPFFADTARTQYDTPSGHLEPGCLYWVDDLPENYFWDNHHGPHLHAIVPSGAHWNIDSRASNCDKKEDKNHRCWVRTGTIPNITVGKGGNTCGAGAGSIWANKDAGPPLEWHGFLQNGEWIKC